MQNVLAEFVIFMGQSLLFCKVLARLCQKIDSVVVFSCHTGPDLYIVLSRLHQYFVSASNSSRPVDRNWFFYSDLAVVAVFRFLFLSCLASLPPS